MTTPNIIILHVPSPTNEPLTMSPISSVHGRSVDAITFDLPVSAASWRQAVLVMPTALWKAVSEWDDTNAPVITPIISAVCGNLGINQYGPDFKSCDISGNLRRQMMLLLMQLAWLLT